VIRQAKRWFVVAQLLPSAVAIAFALMIAATQQDPVAYAPAGLSAAVLVAAYMSTVFATHKPYKWGLTAASYGAYGGLGPGLALSFAVGEQPVSALLALVTGAIGWYVGKSLGGRARSYVAGLRPAELADTDLELSFRARGMPFANMHVGPREVEVVLRTRRLYRYSSCLLEDVTAVERHSVQIAGEHQLPGDRGVMLELAPGSAVRLHEPAGEWVFSTDQAEQAFEVLSRRVEVARTRLAALLAEADEEVGE
jgi:hypothetical protein